MKVTNELKNRDLQGILIAMVDAVHPAAQCLGPFPIRDALHGEDAKLAR
ncbi:hypothetical protein BRPE64_DCDS00990 (plasmid) [Caballeronia insecticola]|uniref:Uncharacterized protein n=1 Tax=Caballeronia insecticola TaxID=758793 RepID=R4WZA4_9BURK|nr:hypothetical protein BRPE64_DCDS00990 [Caballeronia insecticola]